MLNSAEDFNDLMETILGFTFIICGLTSEGDKRLVHPYQRGRTGIKNFGRQF